MTSMAHKKRNRGPVGQKEKHLRDSGEKTGREVWRKGKKRKGQKSGSESETPRNCPKGAEKKGKSPESEVAMGTKRRREREEKGIPRGKDFHRDQGKSHTQLV